MLVAPGAAAIGWGIPPAASSAEGCFTAIREKERGVRKLIRVAIGLESKVIAIAFGDLVSLDCVYKVLPVSLWDYLNLVKSACK